MTTVASRYFGSDMTTVRYAVGGDGLLMFSFVHRERGLTTDVGGARLFASAATAREWLEARASGYVGLERAGVYEVVTRVRSHAPDPKDAELADLRTRLKASESMLDTQRAVIRDMERMRADGEDARSGLRAEVESLRDEVRRLRREGTEAMSSW